MISCISIEKETKEQKAGFLSMLFGTSAASWLGNLLTSKGVIRADEGMFSGGQDF